jgi:hypothetical protein
MSITAPWMARNLESAARWIGVNRSYLSSALSAESAPALPFVPEFRQHGPRPVAAILLAARCTGMGTTDPMAIFPTTPNPPPEQLNVEQIADIIRILLAIDAALLHSPRRQAVAEAAGQLAGIAAVALFGALPAAVRDVLPADVRAEVPTWLDGSAPAPARVL